MARRPASSAGGSRPLTSSGLHHATSPGAFQHANYPNNNAYIEEDEDEESDTEDLFAFLPPSTADQQRDAQKHSQELLHTAPQYPHIYPNAIPPTPPSLSYPLPTFDPYARFPTDIAGPSSLFSPPISNIPVESPPSTISQNASSDPYRMRRLSTAHPATAETRPSRTTLSSREIHVDLPSSPPEKSLEIDHPHLSRRKRNLSSTIADDTTTLDLTPSMLEEDSRDGSIKMEFDFDAINEEDSPFPEVRASVSNIDDPEMPVMTLRMWVIGLVLCMIGGSLNVFFNFRQPAPSVSPLALLIMSYPIGKFFAFILPITTYRLPRWLGGLEFSLNPGPWNIKEHVLVYIMANVAIGPPYAINAIVVTEKNYNISVDYWFSVLLVVATQLTGFGLAGVCRRFLVWPAGMVWPQNLVTCTLLNTLHAEDEEAPGGITRYRYFLLVLTGAFFWFFVPGYLFQGLSVFSWLCWIFPNNVPINQMFGVSSGLGMSVLTFDWSQISWIGSPLMYPWWAEAHIFTGFVLFFWIATPVMYYTNTWDLAYFPINDDNPYDRYGNYYNVTRVLDGSHRFNATAYEEYSPLYLPATYAMTYLLAFALATCVLVHTVLYHGRSVINGIKKIRVEPDDIHAKLMRNYPEVPDWWYLVSFVGFFLLMVVVVEIWHTSVPVWALLLAVFLPVLYVLPSGFIYAMTGQGISLNLLAQIIPGTLLPGNPVANMIFKAYAVQTLLEATSFVQDLKLGHYIKVPPRSTFLVQGVGTLLASFVQVGVKQWMFNNVKDICSPTQASDLTCPHNQVYFTASVVWGLIGPARQFGAGSLYQPELYAIIVGAILPLPFWLWQRRYPNSWVKFVSTPVVLSGVSYIPPAGGINYSAWFATGFVFQYLVRKRNFAWWSKFNYVTSAALDSGTVLSAIVIFFTLSFPAGGVSLKWWGNTVFENTADFHQVAFKAIPSGGLPWP
ncbi:OPT-domain-containing protein [Chiua virens]|nr:OPT-domain-containing protein [Chiua virens]